MGLPLLERPRQKNSRFAVARKNACNCFGNTDLGRRRREGKQEAMKKPESNAREAAEVVAIQALAYIAGESEQLGRFLAITGIGPEQIRQAASEPRFLAGVLAHVMGDERLLVAFADHAGIDPAAVGKAHDALSDQSSGHSDRHWERDVP
jgi:hypothetical protein